MWSSWFRTPALHAGDREFNSRHDYTLSIAQLVEQRTVVPLVTGSNPVAEICLHGPMDKAPAYGAGDSGFESQWRYIILHTVSMPEWSKGARLGRVG